MSVEDANCVTRDSVIGTKPTANLCIPVIWTRTGAEAHDVGINRVFFISTPNVRDWESFRQELFAIYGYTEGDVVTYMDSDDDEIPIESQCELDEALRIATNRDAAAATIGAATSQTLVRKAFRLVIRQGAKRDSNAQGKPCHIQSSEMTRSCNVGHTESADTEAPMWFTSYMQRMKEEIVAEVSKRVKRTVLKAMLQKNRENRHDCGEEYICDSDSKNSMDECETEATSMNPRLPNGDEWCAKKSRHRYRNGEKQQTGKKHGGNKCNGTNNYSASPRHSVKTHRARGEKMPKQTHVDEVEDYYSRVKGYRRGNENFSSGIIQDSENTDEDFDTPRRNEPGITNPCRPEERPVEEDFAKEQKSRMACSLTGNEALERATEFCALSDSDNISIISDISHNHENHRHMSNSFEIIATRSCHQEDAISDFPMKSTLTNGMKRDGDDQEGNRDSSSFELLSEPPSPALSIHMDEDHFSPGIKEHDNYNINGNIAKSDARNKLDALVIDAQGRIHEESDGDPGEIVFEKRTDGSYSFVADDLPGSKREIVIQEITELISDSPDDETIKVDDSASEREREESPETKSRDEAAANENDAFHESTQSFHSHTQPDHEHRHQEFSFASANGEKVIPGTVRSHIFVDVNVSKGLGETRRSTASSTKTHEFSGKEHDASERTKSPRKEAKASPRKASSARGMGNDSTSDGPNKFGPWSTMRNTRMVDEMVFNDVDPLHILPESLVTGAVHVAASAITTARRVYDKLLTAQTRKSTDRLKFGRR